MVNEMDFDGKDYNEIWKQVKNYLENPLPIALPGGTWCFFCKQELCRNTRHLNSQMLLLTINKLMLELSKERKDEKK